MVRLAAGSGSCPRNVYASLVPLCGRSTVCAIAHIIRATAATLRLNYVISPRPPTRTFHAATSQRAADLSTVYDDIIATTTYNNFDMYRLHVDWVELIAEYVTNGGLAADVIEVRARGGRAWGGWIGAVWGRVALAFRGL